MPLPGLATTLPFVEPLHVIFVVVVVIVTAEFTATVAVDVAVFPTASFIVTVYIVFDTGHGLMFCEVAPLLQE